MHTASLRQDRPFPVLAAALDPESTDLAAGTQSAIEPFALADFLGHWHGRVHHDLSASESAIVPLPLLFEMATAEDWQRWQELALGYADPRGALWLREIIASSYRGLDENDVLCCAGAQEGLHCVMRSLLSRDDHAIVIVPIYQPSEQAVTSICAATGVALEDRGVWHLDLDRVARAVRPETKLILINFPNSPTGASLDPATLGALIALCRQHNLWLVNDEVYRLTAQGPHHPSTQVAEIYERGVSVNSVSKGLGLPGLRVGWVTCRDRSLLAKVLTAKSMLSSCMAAPSEILAGIALRAETRIAARNRNIGSTNWDTLSNVLGRQANLVEAPKLDNLAFVSVRYIGPDSTDQFAAMLAHEAGVLVLPWTVWRSKLAEIPSDRLRIGLGQIGNRDGFEAMDAYLGRHIGAGG